MVGLYKDPKGENIFTGSLAVSTNDTSKIETTVNEGEVLGLRRRIKELEDEVKEKDV